MTPRGERERRGGERGGEGRGERERGGGERERQSIVHVPEHANL